MASPLSGPTPPSLRATPRAPNSNGVFIKRRKPADPLVRPKKKFPSKLSSSSLRPNAPPKINSPSPAPTSLLPNEIKTEKGDPESYTEFDLIMDAGAMKRDLRYHVMRLHTSAGRTVNMLDSAEFTPPIRLHRRDPGAPAQGAGSQPAVATVEEDQPKTEEQLRLEAVAAAKEAERQHLKSLTAPTTADKNREKHQGRKGMKKFQQGRIDDNEGRKRLRWEEMMPWVIEDFDNKNTWSSIYEEAMSKMTVILRPDASGTSFTIIPLEKWYKFTQRNLNAEHLVGEELEAKFKEYAKNPNAVVNRAKAREPKEIVRESGMFLVKQERAIGTFKSKAYRQDADDLDYEEDRFADDEEAPLMIGEDMEEVKLAEQKIRREQMDANYFDARGEADADRDQAEEKHQKELKKKFGRKTNKKLQKRENNYLYSNSSDSDDDPWGEDSSSSDEEESDETEKAKEETEKEKDAGNVNGKGKGLEGSGRSSGASTPATQAMQRTSSTQSNSSKRNISSKGGNKRQGSPYASESGNESSRGAHSKKPKLDGSESGQNSRAQSPMPGSPSKVIKLQVPTDALRSVASKKRPRMMGPGSGSDGEATQGEDGSGGEGTVKKIRLNPPKAKLSSNQGSRHGSPVASNGPTNGYENPAQMVSEEAIANAIGTGQGLAMKEFLDKFKDTLSKHPAIKPLWKENIKKVASLDNSTKIFRLKASWAASRTSAAGS